MNWTHFGLTAVGVTALFTALEGWFGLAVMGGFFVIVAIIRVGLDWSDRRWADRTAKLDIAPPKPDPITAVFYLNRRCVHEDLRAQHAVPKNRLWVLPDGQLILPLTPTDARNASSWLGYRITAMGYHESCDAFSDQDIRDIAMATADISSIVDRNAPR